MVDMRSNEQIESEKTKTKKKKKKMRVGDGDGDGGGGINSFPDSMLHHVLSFLSMKQAGQTSLVSKRWRYLWTTLPTLNFTRGQDRDKGIMELLDAVFILRDSSSNIQRFNFYDVSYRSRSISSFDVDNDNFPESDSDYYSDSDSDSSSELDSDSDDTFSAKIPISRLNVWILKAIKLNVEEIHLEICFDDLLELPHCLFTCKSLRKLELISMDAKPHELILPDSICLPRLQILHIQGLTLHHQDNSKITDFLSNCCHGLESLTLKECGLHQKNLNIIAPNLKHLVIYDNSRTKQYLKHGGATGSVRLDAPNLISFQCKDYLSKSYCLENLSSLVEAYIDMKVGSKAKRKAGIWENGRNVMIRGETINFRILHNVKHLTLSAWALQIVIATYELLDNASTEFHNLRSLKLQTWLSEDCIRGITWLLNISPNIEKLSLEIIEDTVSQIFLPHWDEKQLDLADMGDYFKLPLQCVLDHLKIVEIRGLEGFHNELKFLEVLLKNAVVLEKLILVFKFCRQKPMLDREMQLIECSEILHLFPRASSSVTIVLI